MTARRIDMHRLQDLVRLHRLQVPVREVARLLVMSPNTERVYRHALEEAGLLQGEPKDLPELEDLKKAVLTHRPPKQPAQQCSSVEPWAKLIEEGHDKGAAPKAIFDFLNTQYQDFNGSYQAVKRFCARLKRQQGISPEQVVIPVETAPGSVAQIDFGFAGYLYDPEQRKKRKAWFFVMVLGFSRKMFVEIVFDQKTETFLNLHTEAFCYFGGVVETVVPDNLKAAVIRAAFGTDETTSLNRSYRELARHYGFKVDPAPPRSPEKKGKVESGVKYTKNNFLKPRDFRDVKDARAQLEQWLEEVANVRIHGTTHRKPSELFEECERGALLPLPEVIFEPVVWKKAKVHMDCHLQFERCFYSVPWMLCEQEVWVRAKEKSLVLYHEEERVATHPRLSEPGSRHTISAHLPQHRGDWRHREPSYWERRAALLGEDVRSYIQEVFEQDEVLSQLGVVLRMVQLLESVPKERARAACRRAGHFGNYSYRGLKMILKGRLDQLPLETTSNPSYGQLAQPRYARNAAEFLQ